MTGMSSSKKEIHSPFHRANVKISWGKSLALQRTMKSMKQRLLTEREVTLHRLQAAHTLNQIN